MTATRLRTANLELVPRTPEELQAAIDAVDQYEMARASNGRVKRVWSPEKLR
jgi:hypothetical protein